MKVVKWAALDYALRRLHLLPLLRSG